ncbi:hypothetical protein ACOMCU_22405 [Lysinibacillus sp. UGB7]|uniref:hypothetical protein n=1 Tax=Lysinibacillus sp. UGB7 TaxID=3411039 RepID=UPI003B7AFA8B
MEFSEEKIYKIVSDYYKNKGLTKQEFSNRLRAINMLVIKELPMSEAIYWLSKYENDYFEDAETRNKLKARHRAQLNAILKKLGLKSTKEGLIMIV